MKSAAKVWWGRGPGRRRPARLGDTIDLSLAQICDTIRGARDAPLRGPYLPEGELLGALGKQGHELRRPQSAPLQKGVHELRARVKNVNYRVLYFWGGQGVAVLALGCTKEGEVDPAELKRAVQYKTLYEKDPQKHTYRP